MIDMKIYMRSMDMIPLTEIFCLLDDFCNKLEGNISGHVLPNPNRKRKCWMSLSEIMMILTMCNLSHYKTFKDFYLECIKNMYQK